MEEKISIISPIKQVICFFNLNSKKLNKVRILSLDGGGIRGIIPATIVKYVEERIIEKTSNPNARIADYFDMVAGTSTGGILSCLYLTPNSDQGVNRPSAKYRASEALDFYLESGNEIFNKSKYNDWFGIRQFFNATKYNQDKIESLFQEKFKGIDFGSLLKPCLIPTYDLRAKAPFFFVSNKLDNKDFKIKDVLRSTSAAPTYFAPAIIKSKDMVNIDGGVVAQNPTMCAYAEARKTDFQDIQIFKPTAEQMLILSIGTGGNDPNLPDVNNASKWNIIDWAKSTSDIIMEASLDTVDHQMEQLFLTLDTEHQEDYKRIEVPRNKKNTYSSDLADASNKNIEDLKKAANYTLQKAINDDGLNQFIDKLIR